MSASLIVLVPLVLLGVVTALCFVGCGLSVSGLPPDFTTYSDTTVMGNPNIVAAYWRLNETADTDPAADSKGPNKGSYIDPTTTPVPAFYPWPAFSIPDPPNPDIQSAAAPATGNLMLGQQGIVTGDFENGTEPCIVVNGAFVAVPFNATINPSSFTLEAWVRVDWTSSDPLAFRAVVDCRSDNPGQGFALYAMPDSDQSGNYHWQAFVGNGGSDPMAFDTVTSIDPPITLNTNPEGGGTTFYLAVTFDAGTQTLLIFVNGDESSKTTPATYVPNASQPLWIGAGAPFVPQRPQLPGTPASPLFPWFGAIQDVAIYNVALGGDVIIRHFHNGMGKDP